MAYQQKADVDAPSSAARGAARPRHLSRDRHPRRGRHRRGPATSRGAAGSAADRFEFQMLWIRRDLLQASLVPEGYRMRVTCPSAREWFPYFMRRLGERPANLGFVVRALFRER